MNKPNFTNASNGDYLQWKMISYKRRPWNIEIGISWQPLIRSYPNWRLKPRWPTQTLQILQMKTTCNVRRPQNITSRISHQWRWPPMEDELKILVEYLSNHLLDPTQILNISLYDQIILYKFFKWRCPPMEDDLQLKTT